ncbi:MAG: hypothetical protein Q9164_005059 [Protoblastenia rupestris]
MDAHMKFRPSLLSLPRKLRDQIYSNLLSESQTVYLPLSVDAADLDRYIKDASCSIEEPTSDHFPPEQLSPPPGSLSVGAYRSFRDVEEPWCGSVRHAPLDLKRTLESWYPFHAMTAKKAKANGVALMQTSRQRIQTIYIHVDPIKAYRQHKSDEAEKETFQSFRLFLRKLSSLTDINGNLRTRIIRVDLEEGYG